MSQFWFTISLSVASLIGAFLLIRGLIFLLDKQSDSYTRWGGVYMIIIALIISLEVYLALSNTGFFFNPNTMALSIRLTLEWHVVALLASMLSIRIFLGKITNFQKYFFPHILMICIIIAICYHYFSGVYTQIYSSLDIINNIHAKDIQVKLFLFLVSILSCSYILFVPIIRALIKKEIKNTIWIKLYLSLMLPSPILYTLHAFVNPILGFPLVLICLIFMTIYSVVLMKNPDALREYHSLYSTKPVIDIPSKDELSKIIKNSHLYLEKYITVTELAEKTKIDASFIITDYKNKGFSNLNDYLNTFRIVHFKNLAINNPKVPITTLALESGFTSRASFYRYFEGVEGYTPSEFIKRREKNA